MIKVFFLFIILNNDKFALQDHFLRVSDEADELLLRRHRENSMLMEYIE